MSHTYILQNNPFVSRIIDLAIEEDLSNKGDITSNGTLSNQRINFSIKAREDLILSGIEIVKIIFDKYTSQDDIVFSVCKNDGSFIEKDENIITGNALALSLMPLERIILNFLQHCSGVSSYTKKFVEEVEGTKSIIRSTRKTTPGLRLIEKYSVEVGGGENYRMSLSDGVLIKDNHIASCGGISEAIMKFRSTFKPYNSIKIAVECDNTSQVKIASSLNVDLILLDNMSLEDLKKSVEICQGRIELEASGGVNLKNVRSIAETGVNYISVGAITHSFPNKDIALDIVEFL